MRWRSGGACCTALEAAERATDPAERQRLLTFVVVGGGPDGRRAGGRDRRSVARHPGQRLPTRRSQRDAGGAGRDGRSDADAVRSDAVRRARARSSSELGVEVRTGVRVERDRRRRRRRSAARRSQRRTVLWGAGVRPSPLGGGAGRAARSRRARHRRPGLRACPGHPEVFVIGDMAALTPAGASAPLPGISPVAIQQGRAAARNILRATSRRCRASRFVTSTRGSWRRSAARAPSPSSGRCRCLGPDRLAGLGVRAPLVPGRLPQPAGGVHELDLGLRHLAPRRARDHRAARPPTT